MKKIRLYLILFWTIFLIPSCVEPLDQGALPVDIEGEYGIDFSVFCTAPGTKVPKPGVDDYNENLLSTVDWFIFTSDADGSVLYKHGQIVEPDQTIAGSEALKTDDIKIKQLLSMDKYVSEKGKTGYVYVIANLPENSGVTITEGTTTLAALRGIALTADFGKLTNKKFTKQENFVMTGGASFDFNEAKRLIKKAELSRIAAKITLKLNIAPAIDEEKQLATGVMEYQKTWYPVLAPTTITGDNGAVTFNGVQVYLSFANNKSDMKGTLKEYNQDYFFTYNRYAFIPTYNYVEITPGEGGNDTYEYGPNPSSTVVPSLPTGWADNNKLNWSLTGSPFYTYPMEWESDSPQAPFIKVIVEWTPFQETGTFVRDNDGKLIRASRNYANAGPNGNTKEFYYKIPLPDAADCKLLPNDWYELTFDVSILGSTSDELPMELRGQYCVVDWSDPHVDAGGNLVEGSYLSTESDTYYIYGGNSITIPVRSSHNISTEVLGVAFTDYSSMNPTNYTYPVTDNRVGLNNKPFTITTPVDRGAYANDGSGTQNTRRDEFTFTHNLVSDVNAATTTTANPPDVSEYTFHVKITNQAGNEKTIKIIQQPPLMIKNDLNTSGDSNKGHVHINTYTDNNNYHYYFYSPYDNIFGRSYFDQWIESYRDYIGNVFYRTGTIEGVTYDSEYDDTYRGRNTYYLYHSLWLGGVNGRQTSGDNSNQNMYIITSSVAPTGTMIADVRTSSVNNITGTTAASWSSPQGTVVGTTNTRSLTYYHPTNTSESGTIMISPQFRVASSYGIQSGGISYEAAQRRCASYQEDGIPAGRWRIPTRAEIEYMIKLSNIEVIPSLFQPTDYTVSVSSGYFNTTTYSPNYYEAGYWTADGGVIYPWRNSGNNPSIGYLSASELSSHASLETDNAEYAPLDNFVRCVYDEWYWGETTSSQRTNKSTFYWGDKQM